MRLKKHKRHRKAVRFFSACFGFREPFKVLCDGTFIHHLLLHRILPAADALVKLLGGRVILFSSRCITAELKSLGDSHAGSLQASQQLNTARCDHEKRLNAAMCIESIIRVGNTEHYFVATQDAELRRKLREMPGVPVIYGLNNSLFIEQPSMQQRDFAKSSEEDRLRISESEIQMLLKRERKSRLPEQVTTDSADAHDISGNDVGVEHSTRFPTARQRLDLIMRSKFKRKKAKGPNQRPCKKMKIKESSSITNIKESSSITNKDGGPGDSRKRKRNRKRKRSQKGAKLGLEGS